MQIYDVHLLCERQKLRPPSDWGHQVTKIPRLLTFTDTYLQLLAVTDTYWHLKTQTNDELRKRDYDTDTDDDGKKPNE